MQAVLKLSPDPLPVLPACYFVASSTVQIQGFLSAVLVGLTDEEVPLDFIASLWPWFFHVGQIQTQYSGILRQTNSTLIW